MPNTKWLKGKASLTLLSFFLLCLFPVLLVACSAPPATSHRVSSGQQLDTVARMYNLPPEYLAQANNLTITSTLSPGQELIIPPPPTPVSTDPAYLHHYVGNKETLTSIANLYHVSVADLQNLNGLTNPNHLRLGQLLLIPPQPTPPLEPTTPPPHVCKYYVQSSTDTIEAIAKHFKLSPDDVLYRNGLPSGEALVKGQILQMNFPYDYVCPASTGAQPFVSGSVTPAPSSNTTQNSASQFETYIVQRGDTLSTLAGRFNTTTAILMSDNRITNSRYIYPGQRLQVRKK